MTFLSRRPPGPDRFLIPKLVLLGIGSAVLLYGMARNNQAAVIAAVVILVPAFLLRFFGTARVRDEPIHEDWYAPDPVPGERRDDGGEDGDTHEGAAR